YTIIGGGMAGARNVISGNAGDGINISGSGLPNGAVSWWKADGSAVDVLGANSGVLENGASFAAGKIGQAFSFDGTDDAVRMAGQVLTPAAFTVEAWINASSFAIESGRFRRIVTIDDAGYAGDNPFAFYVNPDGTPAYVIGNGSGEPGGRP